MPDSHLRREQRQCGTCFILGLWGYLALQRVGLLITSGSLPCLRLYSSQPSVLYADFSTRNSLYLGKLNENFSGCACIQRRRRDPHLL